MTVVTSPPLAGFGKIAGMPKKPPVKKQEVERWRKQGKALRISQHQWKIAEWVLRGEKIFKTPGAAYDEAVKLTGMTRATIRQFAHTARNVSRLTRVNALSFGHHRLVAKYESEDQKRYLKHAKDAGESVDSFAAYLRTLDKDAARRADKRTHGDRAADKFMEACHDLQRCGAFVTLLSKQPTPEKQTELLNRLRVVIAELNSKVTRLEKLWTTKEQAMAVGSGK